MDPVRYIKGINEPLGEIFQIWVENRTREGDLSIANLVDFLVRVDMGHDAESLYEHFLGPVAESVEQPIKWPSNYDISALVTYELMVMLQDIPKEEVEKPSAEEYQQAVRQAGDEGLRWLGDEYVPSFLRDASLIVEEESQKLIDDLNNLVEEPGDEVEQPLEEVQIDPGEQQGELAPPDPEKQRRALLATWPGAASAQSDRNQRALKNLAEDRDGANPLPLLVMENWIQVGEGSDSLKEDEHQFLLANATRGSVWIPLKGGVFNPGTIAVSGDFTQEDKDRIVRRFAEFSKKAVEFR
ncbi:MAG: hypothetical protein KGQ66_13495 [Acidobacteriota bacterium]|nr:hypothetical protein [Acidobacteriota bacterium]